MSFLLRVLFAYRTCPVRTVGHAGTNIGCAAGRDLVFWLLLASLLSSLDGRRAPQVSLLLLDYSSTQS